jgi:hypothetical protein
MDPQVMCLSVVYHHVATVLLILVGFYMRCTYCQKAVHAMALCGY